MSQPLRRRRLTRNDLLRLLLFAAMLLLATAVLALCVGPERISVGEIFSEIFSPRDDATGTILFGLRLPRLALAISVGAALASSGVLFQALLRNPLAEPYILGVSNGCAVGAILGYLIGIGSVGTPLLSFAGGGIVVLVVLGIGRGSYGLRSESMLLGGAMVAAITAAIIFLLLGLLGPQLRSALQWMLGDLSSASVAASYSSLGLFVALFIASLFAGDILNALALGEEEAASLGVDVTRVRVIAYLIGSFVVGLSVAFCGAIGFVGLVVPHILRRMIGPDHRALLPASVLGGGVFLLLCDTIARSLMSAVGSTANELPIGAITALIGAPIFILLLRRGRGE
jgi:iron complex transport system permease protein